MAKKNVSSAAPAAPSVSVEKPAITTPVPVATPEAAKPVETAAPIAAAKKPAAKKAAVKSVAAPVAPAKKALAAKKPAAKKAAAPKTKGAKAGKYSDDDIALRAYFISQHRHQHHIHGDSHSDWMEAERQLAAEHGKPKRKKS